MIYMIIIKYYFLVALVLFVPVMLTYVKRFNKYASEHVHWEDIEEAILTSLAWPLYIIGLLYVLLVMLVVGPIIYIQERRKQLNDRARTTTK